MYEHSLNKGVIIIRIALADINEIVKVNKLKEITTSTYFEYKGIPTEDGIFSFQIFGKPGSYDRKTTFAYIDLHDPYLHPLAYKTLIRLNRKFESCITGKSWFKIDSHGELVEVKEEELAKLENDEAEYYKHKIGTGLKWLYNNWERLKFKRTKSQDRTQRIKFFTTNKKDVIWQTKELVIPPFYRDINFEKIQYNVINRDVLNELYTRLLRLLSSVKFNALYSDDDRDFEDPMVNNSRVLIQNQLNEIYAYFIGRLELKNGLIHKGLMGKSIDYSGISVITSPKINQERYEDMPVNFFNMGIPLYQVCNLFYPFIIKWLTDWFSAQLTNNATIYPYVDGKKGSKDKLNTVYHISPKTMDDYDSNNLHRIIKRFSKTPNSRFDKVTVRVEEIDEPVPLSFSGVLYNPFNDEPNESDSGIANRPLTWTDLLFMAAYNTTQDKHVFITRYPITSNLSIFPSKVNINSTINTQPVEIEGIKYPRYPVIDLSVPYNKVESQFIDSVQMFNGTLKGLNGDFDRLAR